MPLDAPSRRGCASGGGRTKMVHRERNKNASEDLKALREAVHAAMAEENELDEIGKLKIPYHDEAEQLIRLHTRLEFRSLSGDLTPKERKEMELQIAAHEATMNALSHRIEQLNTEAGIHANQAEETLAYLHSQADWKHHLYDVAGHAREHAFANVNGFREGVEKHGEDFSITSTFASHLYGAAETHDLITERRKKKRSMISKAHMAALANWTKAVREYEIRAFGHVGTLIPVEKDWTATRPPPLAREDIVKITPVMGLS